MQCKTGAEHLRSLKDGRTVYLDGKLVEDVTVHPAYRNAVASAALLYDYQARPENIELMTFMPAGGTRRVNRCWQMPRNYDELVQRRKALQAWAQVSYGFMGRSPDHVASTVIGQHMGLDVFRKHGSARAKAVADYAKYATRNDLFLTYVLVNPQADRSKDWGDQVEELVAQIVDEDTGGLTIRGAEAIGATNMPQVREQLGSLAASAGMVDAMLAGMEAAGGRRGEFYLPNRHHLYAAQVVTQDLYPRLINLVRELAGGSLIMVPSSFRDWANPELAPICTRRSGRRTSIRKIRSSCSRLPGTPSARSSVRGTPSMRCFMPVLASSRPVTATVPSIGVRHAAW